MVKIEISTTFLKNWQKILFFLMASILEPYTMNRNINFAQNALYEKRN